MVECKGNAHELSLCNCSRIIHDQLILHCADTQNACIRLIDDRIKGFYAEHTQIGDGEGRALIFIHRQLICSCTLCQISRCFGNFTQTHLIRILDNGHNQTILQRNRHTDIHKFDFTGLQELTDWLCQANVPVYLTIDLDCLDPSAFPGTGTPEAGGVSFLQLLGAIRTVTKANIIGADVNELAPMLDQSGVSTATACKVLRELLLALD
jgi:hypothetical protein